MELARQTAPYLKRPRELSGPTPHHRFLRRRLMHVRKSLPALVAALVLAGAANFAHADINVGVTLSATGPAASLGIPEKNTIALLPQTVAGQKVNYIVLD